jgi:hypothetical protein
MTSHPQAPQSGGEVDTIFGFEKEADALSWIKEKSQEWLMENK